MLNAIESSTEETNINVLRLSIGKGLPFESILAQNSGRNIALGNVVALLFELLLSPIQEESKEALNLLKEGITKRKDFKIAICGRVEFLLNLTGTGVRQWDPIEADELLFALLNSNEERKEKGIEKEQDEEGDNDDDEEGENNKLQYRIQDLILLLNSRGLKKVNMDQQSQYTLISALRDEIENIEKEKEENERINVDEKIQIKSQLDVLKEENEQSNKLLEREKEQRRQAVKEKQDSQTRQRELEEELKQKEQIISKFTQSEQNEINLRRIAEESEKIEKEEKERQIIRAEQAEKENKEIKAQNVELKSDLFKEIEIKEKEQNDKISYQKWFREELKKRQERDNQIKK
ncbi:MAG: hypothetical protein EZS28_046436, partial [Streblomastix strix]